jgi:ASPIC and UnbV/FG-GAP-like repeat
MFLDCSFAVVPLPQGEFAGISLVDLDGDGQFEILIANRTGPNRILKWVGGSLRDLVHPQLADSNRPTVGAVAADFDGDGREELYLVSGIPHHDRLYDCQIDGSWIDLFDQLKTASNLNRYPSRAVAAIDRRGNGRYSFIVVHDGKPIQFFELNREQIVTDLAASLELNRSCLGGSLAVGPIVSGRSDFLCVNQKGPNFLFRNTGLGRFEEVAAGHQLHDAEEHGAAVAFWDADCLGKFGLCWGNHDGPHRLMVPQPDGRFRNAATPAMAMPSELRAAIVADFDNDGHEELFFGNSSEGNRLFHRSLSSAHEWQLIDAGAAAGLDGGCTGAAVADIDNDGRLELLISNDLHGLQLFKWPASERNWLRVRPLTRFGAAARGAVVELQAAGRLQSRIICGGSSSACQMEPVAHFGLGFQETVERIRVIWPDETTTEIVEPGIRKTVIVNYPGSG